MLPMRVFVAIPLPSELKAKLVILQQEFRQISMDATWVREAGFHVTLKFLGEVQPGRMPSIADAILETGQRYRPFSITLRGIGAFPNVSRPRVLWVGLEQGGGVLRGLQKELEENLALRDFPPDERPYNPHLTLARLKHVKQHREFLTCMSGHRDDEIGHFDVNCLELLESQLHSMGARYSVINATALVS
jgi:RNA 2',3'-cyclic 3'-phosphodiesterase